MKQILLLKKVLPSILYTVLGLVGVYVLYRLFIRFRQGGLAVGNIIADKAENAAISKETGLDPARVQEMRLVARDTAYELETAKDMSFFEKLQNVQFDSDNLKIFNRVKSVQEMKVVKSFYSTIWTDGNDLLTDLKETTLSLHLNDIPFVAGLY